MSAVAQVLLSAAMVVAAPELRQAAKATLERAIEHGVPQFNAGRADACAAIYEVATRATLAMAGAALSEEERSRLKQALARQESDATERAWTLRRAIDEVLDSLSFEPLIEAPLPEGFPAPGPVGQVVAKRYPRYRAARAEGGGSFWTLFRHIKKNDIAMTAPVEMTMAESDGGMRTVDMAFLYERTSQGRAGRDGRVDVVDLEPVLVLSVGIRGPMTAEQVERAKRAIERKIARSAKRWQRAGEWRMLGYNSPMVPAKKRFWELQLPVTETY